MNADTTVTRIEELLAHKGYRRTTARRALIATFVASVHALPLPDVITQAVSRGIDRSSAYRGLSVLEGEGIITASVTRGIRHYELAQPHSPHHHHLTCSTCGRVISIHSPKLEEVIKFITEKHHFTASSHTFEITGTCEDCLRTRKRENQPQA